MKAVDTVATVNSHIETVKTVYTVKTVRTATTVDTVETVKTANTVKTVDTVKTVNTVKTANTVEAYSKQSKQSIQSIQLTVSTTCDFINCSEYIVRVHARMHMHACMYAMPAQVGSAADDDDKTRERSEDHEEGLVTDADGARTCK